jgi:hypothetical protein
MRDWRLVFFAAALLGAACASQAENNNTPENGAQGGSGAAPAGDGGSGGKASGQGGKGGTSNPSTGGDTGSGGTPASGGSPGSGGELATGGVTGTGGTPSGSGGDSGTTPDAGAGGTTTPPMTGGKALLVTGTIPLVGTDVVFEATFKARGLEVEIVQEKLATPASADGKRVVMLSYGMSSTAFKAEDWVNVPVPLIVTEQNLLPRLKMSSVHGFTGKMSKLTFVSDHELAAGFPKGDLEVYMPAQEFFYGTPSAAGIRIAHLVGAPDKVTYFAYEKGAMMDSAVAPAKRVQFFHATHSPDPIDKNLYLNANGLKLLGAAIDWCLK